MKIVTVNVPESYINLINKLIGEDGLYPSRSELIRAAVREFLLKELHLAQTICKDEYIPINKRTEISSVLENKDIVNVPDINFDKNGEKIRKFKTYKILRRLENPNI